MTSRKLTSPLKYQHFALIILTSGTFPIDNLRYDDARPWKETDARMIQDACAQIVIGQDGKPYRGEDVREQRIIICKYSESAATTPHMWRWDRWRSGGLRFEPITYDEAERLNQCREMLPARLQYPELASI